MTEEDWRNPKHNWKVGSVAERPVSICATPNSMGLGNFVSQLLLINSVAECFDHRRLTVVYKDDAPFKADLLKLLPADRKLALATDATLPTLDIFNRGEKYGPRKHAVPSWFSAEFPYPEIVITDTMASGSAVRRLDRISRLTFTAEDAEQCAIELKRAGVDANRWFCTLHCAEPGDNEQKQSGDPLRYGDPGVYFAVAQHVIRRLGGQVVRLGYPSRTPFPAVEGMIDLSLPPASPLLQAFAISRSRFLFSGAVWSADIAAAFNVPNAQLDAVENTTANDHLILRTVDVITPDGAELAQEAFFEAGLGARGLYAPLSGGKKYSVARNTPPEALRLADFAHELTDGVAGWRNPPLAIPGPRPNQISWPGGTLRAVRFLAAARAQNPDSTPAAAKKPSHRDGTAPGVNARNPIKICAIPCSKSFGDFTTSLLFIKSVAGQFDHRRLTVIYKDDRDFKSAMLRLLPADNVISVPGDQSLPSLDMFNAVNTALPFDPNTKPWFDGGLNEQDLILTDAIATGSMLRIFQRLSHLRFPDDDVAACTKALIAAGLRPDKWFVTLHCREPGYQDKPTVQNLRDGNPAVFHAAATHIIRKLGGQVVRLGHPSMKPYPEMTGLIDLSRSESSSYLQAFAISRSRFLLAGPSGPSGVASALDVPHAQLDAVDYYPHNEREIVRSVDMLTPEGDLLSQQALFDSDFSKLTIENLGRKPRGYTIFKNPPAELIRLANYAYDMTGDVTRWRTPRDLSAGPRPNQFLWPATPKPRGSFLPEART